MASLLESKPLRRPALVRGEAALLSLHLPGAEHARIKAYLLAAADPDAAIHYLLSLKQRRQDTFERLVHSPSGLPHFVTVTSFSRFLSEELLQNPQWLEEVSEMDRVLTAAEYKRRLGKFLKSQPEPEPLPFSLALFRRQQILRILLRDALGAGSLSETTEELSNLADAILHVGYKRIVAELASRHGTPRYLDQNGEARKCGMSVIALGKLGGRELNYSSDIDLMFVFTANGETDGERPISNKEFYKKVANQYTELLSTYTAEGLCYRVDLRLRPDGSLGEASISLDGAKSYYQNRARDWELQMLIKARVAAGDPEAGRELLSTVEPLIYSTTLDFSAVEAMSATRDRITEQLNREKLNREKLNRRKLGKPVFDVKLAPGGIRDIEFLVQCLQRLHGGRVPWLRHGGTMLALSRLNDKDLLSAAEYGRLIAAYGFLRHLEHRLQIAEDRQTHILPASPRELDLLARKMPSAQPGSVPSGEKLLQELNAHLEAVQEIYERVIHAQRPIYYSLPPAVTPQIEALEVVEPTSSNVIRFLDERAPELAGLVSGTPLRGGAKAFEHFLEKLLPDSPWLAWLNADGQLARSVLDIFESSPYFAEELVRHPDLMEELAARHAASRTSSSFEDISDLRRFFRREMVRIQAASICQRVPVFETLHHTSDLADAAISACYRMAVEHAAATHPPKARAYQPHRQLMVIALGRLGMREFDLASDADLIFVLPDEDRDEHSFWTRVAERIVDLITAYTGTGVMFTVDTRLRPNGSAGALLQSEASYKEYFDKNAEAWEGIAYMKARAVAGDTDRATTFLNELQKVDWRRYGQGGRSKRDLRQMRLRLEKEQGPDHPLKAGPGGFYDIDFLLLFLRLKAGGIFYKVLNTPERVEIVEAMGHLERADAQFLLEAATFYRAVDHALRVFSGHAETKLPNSESHLQVLTGLVQRWIPERGNGQPLKTELAKIQNRTRQIFERLFAS